MNLATLFFNFIFSIISYLISLLPKMPVTSSLSTAVTTANSYISALNWIIPVDTLLHILDIFIGFEGTYLTFKITMWVLKRLPTQS